MEDIEIIKIGYKSEQINLGLFQRECSFLDDYKFVDKLNSKYGIDLKVIRPQVAELLVNDPQGGKVASDFSPFMTNVIVAYTGRMNLKETDRQLRSEIFYSGGDRSYILPTKVHEGKQGIAIVVPDVTARDFNEDNGEVILDVPEERLLAVENFPPTNGWYHLDSLTTIPIEPCVAESVEARYLIREQKPTYRTGLSSQLEPLIPFSGEYVGPLYRCAPLVDAERAGQALALQPTTTKGLILEISDKDLKTMTGEKSSLERIVNFFRSKKEDLT
ncbi:hypothetical protein GF345_05895 [Candidatus Woesearchaeota archaeon]|nr:hypothetical protein [Candidatus Woesearchaeota archaeon]